MGRYVVVVRRLWYCISFLVSFLSGCSNRFDAASTEGVVTEMVSNITIESLHSLSASSSVLYINQDLLLCGTVTANDKGGNFYKSFVIEQDGYALEVLDGLTYTYLRFQEECMVYVDLNGLCVARGSRGVLQVGVEPSAGSYYDLDYLGHELLVNNHITNSGIMCAVTPREVTLEALYNDIGAELLSQLCGCLVSIEGLTYSPDEDETGIVTWSGDRVFVDDEGREVGSYCSSYSSFSGCEIPLGRGTLVGILQSSTESGESYPTIKMRRESDFCEDDI